MVDPSLLENREPISIAGGIIDNPQQTNFAAPDSFIHDPAYVGTGMGPGDGPGSMLGNSSLLEEAQGLNHSFPMSMLPSGQCHYYLLTLC